MVKGENDGAMGVGARSSDGRALRKSVGELGNVNLAM